MAGLLAGWPADIAWLSVCVCVRDWLTAFAFCVQDALTSANMFQGPSIVLAPRTQSMLETMSKVGAGDQPVHYTWDPRKPVGSMLAVSADCKHMVVDPTFLKGEENLSLVLAEVRRPSCRATRELSAQASARQGVVAAATRRGVGWRGVG